VQPAEVVRTQPDGGNLQSGSAQIAIFHARSPSIR
jgi:hypothetical protein